MKAFSY